MAETTHISLDDVLVSAVAQEIISYLSLRDLVALQLVSRSICQVVQSRLDYRFNLDLFLKNFVQKPSSLRCQLGKTDAIIVRGSALNFLEIQHAQRKCLDLLVEDGQKANSLLEYLRAEESCVVRSKSQQPARPQAFEPAPTERWIILRRITPALVFCEPQIRITITTTFPIYSLLSNAAMSAELNFITWKKAYCLLPAATLVNHRTYPLRPLDDEFGNLLAEYSHYGWTTRDMLWLELGAEDPRGMGPRRVGDANSAIISVAPQMEIEDSTPDYVIEYAAFDVCGPDAFKHLSSGLGRRLPMAVEHQSRELSVDVKRPESSALRYHFTTAQKALSDSWATFLDERLERWARIEMFKIPRTERRFSVESRGALPTLNDSQRPVTWDYADDQIPVWYETFWQAHMAKIQQSAAHQKDRSFISAAF